MPVLAAGLHQVGLEHKILKYSIRDQRDVEGRPNGRFVVALGRQFQGVARRELPRLRIAHHEIAQRPRAIELLLVKQSLIGSEGGRGETKRSDKNECRRLSSLLCRRLSSLQGMRE